VNYRNRVRSLLAAILLAATPPSVILAQQGSVTVHGKVTTLSGTPIDGATIYVPELAASTRTVSGGIYSLRASLVPDQRTRITLDVRASGFTSRARSAFVSSGAFEQDFQLEPAPRRVHDRLSDRHADRDVTSELSSGPTDDLTRSLFEPALIRRYQYALELSAAQRIAIQALIQQTQEQIEKRRWIQAFSQEKLATEFDRDTVDEKIALVHIDSLLSAEREIRRLELTMSIRIKNILTPVQHVRLRQLRRNED
jgi:hypothetical protein